MRRRLPILWLAGLALVGAPHAAPAQHASVDAAGTTIVARDAARVVAVGGTLTEIVFALGAERHLVGVDSTSQFPAAAKALPQVGYMRTLSVEGVLSLRPTLVLLTEDAGPPAAVAQLRGAGVTMLVLPNSHDMPGIEARIRGVATALALPAPGAALAAQVRADLVALGQALAVVAQRPRVLFILAAGQGSTMVSGRDTAADAMIALAGGANAVTAYDGYRPMTAEAVIAAAPDVILLPSHSTTTLGGLDSVRRLPGVATTPAARNGRIAEMDSLALLGFGPRTAQTARGLALLLHPDLPLGAKWTPER
ncbi:MAG: ABC transporter substrate-binding protein [Proteobacteria bacterium]|nr:ABC transporter substrate-binding protein [Pseudomonadota bacterium]